ncbi:MAG: hypothetical protein Q4A98_08405 [Comamonadaceae bacterium]|nr:hypothetical protein [Comamonadaceae bacterium]
MQTSAVWKWSALALACSAILAGCGGGGSDVDDDHDHSHIHIDTKGRLVVLEAGSPQVHVVDLDRKSVMQSYTADHVPSAVYASPGQRYALLMQRAQNQVQVVDGGIWQEDHGNHMHDYMQPPALLGTRLAGVRPTHYDSHAGQAAIFFDGNQETGEKAAVAVISDASLGKGQAGATLARQGLDAPMHGTAQPRGDYLLTTWRAADAQSTLPSQVELYHRHDDHYHVEKRFDAQCPGLHGSYSNAQYSAFGCSDGVLVVQQNGDQFTARKIANPADMGEKTRIGALLGHAQYGKFVGIAGAENLFEVDPAAGTITRIQWAEGRKRRAHAIDAEGKNLLILDDQGTLHILSVGSWRKRAQLPGVIANMPTKAPYPAFAISAADDDAWLSDPLGKRLLSIDIDDAKIEGSIPVNFTPTGMTWLGLRKHTH